MGRIDDDVSYFREIFWLAVSGLMSSAHGGACNGILHCSLPTTLGANFHCPSCKCRSSPQCRAWANRMGQRLDPFGRRLGDL